LPPADGQENDINSNQPIRKMKFAGVLEVIFRTLKYEWSDFNLTSALK
jgi:hypothetical protein